MMEHITGWMIWTYLVSVILLIGLFGATLKRYSDTPKHRTDSEDIWYIWTLFVIALIPAVNTITVVVFTGLFIDDKIRGNL